MKIFTYKERSEILRETISGGDPAINDIVDRAGEGVAKEIEHRWEKDVPITVFAGWGMKGAYALAAARHLILMGYTVEIYLFNIGGTRLCDEAFAAEKALTRDCPDADLMEITQNFDIPQIDDNCIVLDGLFGASLERPLPRSFGMLIRAINESGAYVVAIEIPSGLFSEWNANNSISRDIIHASLTIALQAPCMAFFIKENIPLIGEWKIIDIGMSRQAMRSTPYTYYLVTRRDVHNILRERPADSSKADYGSAIICAGSYGMMGAAVLATRACLRAGVGKVTCYSPRCGFQIIQTAVPSAMFSRDSHDNFISSITLKNDYQGIALGPGIGTSEVTVNAVESFLKMMYSKHTPLVLDADALNCIALRPNMMNYVPQESILTPHEGEFDRIFGKMPSSEARLQKALEVAAYHNILIVLKSRYTAIIRPDGKVHFNSSGTPALATAGSGDVLTGVITAFLAQGYAPEIAAILGVYIHGYAGELAEAEFGSYGVIAEDVTTYVAKAIKETME